MLVGSPYGSQDTTLIQTLDRHQILPLQLPTAHHNSPQIMAALLYLYKNGLLSKQALLIELQLSLGGSARGLGAVLLQQLKRHDLRRLLVRALKHNQGCLPRTLRLQPSRGAQTPVFRGSPETKKVRGTRVEGVKQRGCERHAWCDLPRWQGRGATELCTHKLKQVLVLGP